MTAVVLFVSIAASVRGQSADGFDPNANGDVLIVAVQPDGKILIGGSFTTLSPNGGVAVTRNYIARLNPDGTLDTVFDPNANGSVLSIAVQVDGKILVGGSFDTIGGQTRIFIARLDAATGLADSFDPNANGSVYSIAVQADGKILAGGLFTNIGGQTRNRIARLDATTGLADSFNPNADTSVYAIAVQADGKILAGGNFNSIGGQTRNLIARLDPTTGLADSFDPNANNDVRSIAVQANGKILAGGLFTGIGGQTRNFIARLDATTGLADAFDPNAIQTVVSIAAQADGKILAGGIFSSIGGQPRNHIARLDATSGGADSFDPNANGNVFSIAVQADGKILAGGSFNFIGGQTRNRIARLFVTAPTPTPSPTQTPAAKFTTLSTRDVVGTGDAVTVNAFIITGSSPKQVIVRGLGPSLPYPGLLQDPALELHGPIGFTTATNNNWRDTQQAQIIATGLPPTNDLESAIVANLAPGVYTVVLFGVNGVTGTGVNELYDLNPGGSSRLTAVGTQGSALTGGNVQVSGVSIQDGGPVLLRVLGPTLPVSGQLGDPTLELRDGNGALIVANDNWRSNQEAEIIATGIPPTNDLESAIVVTLPPGTYTAIVGGVNNTTGIGYVQFYGLPHSGPVLPLTLTPPVITSPLVATGTVGQPFTYQFTASGATSLGASNLAPGLTFNTSLRAITGTPTAAGTFQVGLSATNSGGTTSATLTITVQPVPPSGPVIGSSTAVTGRVGQPFRFQVYTTGGSPAARVSASGLPPGLSIDAVTGLISGTPTAAGSSAVTLTVTDGAFTTSSILQLTFTADPALPVITSPSSAALTPGVFFSYTITAPTSVGASDPTVFTLVGTLPPGLTFNAATGTISGIYTGPLRPDLAGGTLLGSIQLFATNSHGTSTFDLLFRAPPKGVVNIATRTTVGTGDNVLIGGFIVDGDVPKIVIIRAIGPSLNAFLSGALQDPTLELHDSAHPDRVVFNDNWRDTQESIILGSGLQPANNSESAIVVALDPGSYTAIVHGTNATTGIAVVDVFDLGTANAIGNSGSAKVANIATRGFVNTGDNVMIGGVIIQGQPTRVMIRAIGPALTQFGVPDALANPQLELHDATSTIAQNDDWQTTQIGGIITSDQVMEIQASGLVPTNTREAAIIVTLPPGSYTAIVRGANNTTGNALVEVYALQ